LRNSSGEGIMPGARQRAEAQSGWTSSLRRWSVPRSKAVKYLLSIIVQRVFDSVAGDNKNVVIACVAIDHVLQVYIF
jgi:hypothetical protein